MAIENLPSHLDPNDPLVKQAHQGKGWGEQDQRRYDKLKGTLVGQKEARNMTDGGLRQDYAALQQKKAEGADFSNRADNIMQRKGERIQKIDARKSAKSRAQAAQGSTGQSTNPIDNTQTAVNDSVPSNQQINDTNIKNIQEQRINQNNDIKTDVNGNNNTVINNQDNSIRQYGGDNRSFVYNSNGGSSSDSPVSAATMSGYYDVDDSPAAQAKFQSMYKDFNRGNSNRFAGQALQSLNTYAKNFDPREYTAESMENALGRSTQYSFDRADRQTGHVFGDIWNDNYITEEWKMPSSPKPIESNAEKIADKAKEDIEDL